MSRKNKAPKRIFYPESKYQSLTLSKFINFIIQFTAISYPAAEDDITELCHKRGHELLELKKNGNDLEFTIKKIK